MEMGVSLIHTIIAEKCDPRGPLVTGIREETLVKGCWISLLTLTCLMVPSWWLLALKQGVTVDFHSDFVRENHHLVVARIQALVWFPNQMTISDSLVRGLHNFKLYLERSAVVSERASGT